MSTEMDTKCESPLGYAVESELGVRTCISGALYIMTSKAASSELFFYRCNPTTGEVIYKINLWTVVSAPGTVLSLNVGRIVVAPGGEFAYVNFAGGLLKIRTGVNVDLADRIVWQVFGGSRDLSVAPDGDPRHGAVRIDALTGATVWGVFSGSSRQDSGLDNGTVWAVTVSGLIAGSVNFRVFKHDEDGVLEWVTIIDTAFGGVNSNPVIQALGVGVADNGNIWVAYSFSVAVGLNVQFRYRLKMLDQDGVLILNQPFASGEAPTIRGNSQELQRTPSRTGATWRYTIAVIGLIRRTKRIDNNNSEVSTSNHTVANFPQHFIRGNTGDYAMLPILPREVHKLDGDLLTTIVAFTPVVLDDGIHGLVYLGVTD